MKIVLTGGGTAGHVMPHLALIPELIKDKNEIFYIGSRGIEYELMQNQPVTFTVIHTGKLRRYFSWENFLDILRVILGCVESFWILLRLRPDVIFSKGGFVSVPVAFAGRLLGIPVLTHESDVTPGLANKMITPLASKIFYSFPDTEQFVPKDKGLYTGSPVRRNLLEGDVHEGLKLCEFPQDAIGKVILVMGGSQGAQKLNDALLTVLPKLLETSYVVHLTGRGKALSFQHPHYKGFEFVKDELKDIFALCNYVITRSGANSIFEMLALHKPMLLVPLEVGSRGDQVINAENFVKAGWAHMLREKELTSQTLLSAIAKLVDASATMQEKQRQAWQHDPVELIKQEIIRAAKQ